MLFLIAYISSVVLINYAFSTAPHLDIIWSAWGGLVFILRDMVQTRFWPWRPGRDAGGAQGCN